MPRLSPVQRNQMVSTVKDLLRSNGLTDRASMYIFSRLFQRRVPSAQHLTYQDWLMFRETVYPDWQSGSWDVSERFKLAVMELCYHFREEILGQKRLL